MFLCIFTSGACVHTWSEPVDVRGISGYNIKKLVGKSVMQCKAACEAEGSRCRSMDYVYKGSICHIQYVTARTAGAAFKYYPSEEHYDRSCDNGEYARRKGQNWYVQLPAL